MDIVLTIIAVILVVISVWVNRTKRLRNRLPGPIGLPIVGYLPFITSKPYVVFQQLAKTYGPVFEVKLGSRKMVVICNFKFIKEAFSDDIFMGRPSDAPLGLSETSIKTGAFVDMQWKEQRRFTLLALRDLGFGRTLMEEQLKEEILEVLDLLEGEMKHPVKMSDFLAPSTSNVISSLLFGKRMKFNDPKRKRLNIVMNNISLGANTLRWPILFPWAGRILRHLNFVDTTKFERNIAEVKEYIREEITYHEATLDPSNSRDFIDQYIMEIQKKVDDDMSTFKREVLVDLCRIFFGAGSEAIRVPIDWMLLLAAELPEIQDKIQLEIDEVLGHNRFPTYQDRIKMPYTEACILESMRWKSIHPLNVIRSTLRDTALNGYFIPKNSYILAVLYGPDHDEALWGKDVHEYKPERFLSDDGKKVIKPEYHIPFSIGKRSCPARTLAEIELFLYVAAILQKFRLSMPHGQHANFEGVHGISCQPIRQNICLQLR